MFVLGVLLIVAGTALHSLSAALVVGGFALVMVAWLATSGDGGSA
jgi:hypothetical protein